MTYQEIVKALLAAGIESAEWEAQLLLSHFFSADRALILSERNRTYESELLSSALERRCKREPLQYILGEWDFYRQTYEVTPDCLIPRSDTEILVEEAIKRLPKNAFFADLCTGSGCIAISVLAERKDTKAYAADKFEKTLNLATRNAEKNRVRERFTPLCLDVLTDALPDNLTFDAILCNPPYITPSVIDGLSPEVHFEPRAALDGGEDGLIFYRTLLRTMRPHLKTDGFFLFEIGYDQGESLLSLAREYDYPTVRILRDLSGNDRVVYISQERNQQ